MQNTRIGRAQCHVCGTVHNLVDFTFYFPLDEECTKFEEWELHVCPACLISTYILKTGYTFLVTQCPGCDDVIPYVHTEEFTVRSQDYDYGEYAELAEGGQNTPILTPNGEQYCCWECWNTTMDECEETRRCERYEDEYLIDGVGFADPGGNSALRAETPDNPRNRPCPTCHRPNMLTAIDVQRGYQCDICADALEGPLGLHSFTEY